MKQPCALTLVDYAALPFLFIETMVYLKRGVKGINFYSKTRVIGIYYRDRDT